MKKIIIITGQTATGKTKKALSLAKTNGGDLISADSRQLYRFLNIITGKDVGTSQFTKVCTFPYNQAFEIGYYQMGLVRLWGLDIVDPSRNFSSHDYKQLVDYIMSNTIDKTSIPIVIGGTFFYIKHLLGDISVQVPANWKLRSQLEQLSIAELQKKLFKAKPELLKEMNNSDKLNPHRLIRKIEIAESEGDNETKTNPLYHVESFIGLKFKNRSDLRQRVTQRVAERLSQGAIDEVKKLLKKGYSTDDPGLKTIGYTQIIQFLNGDLSYEHAVEKWITAEMHYAKRQYTLMKKDQRIEWHEV